jgi:DNA helicase-2/ATP-dependent DNA helicase PcrA
MSRMYLAAAGSGKTTFLLERVSDQSKRFLYTTFTDENAAVAKDMLIEKFGYIPSNVTILPWFSFLLEHGVRPFQESGGFGDVNFGGVCLLKEGKNCNKRPSLRYFCNSSCLVYAAKLPDLALHCDDCSGGAVFERIRRLFDVVLIDEAQDMAGYDFDFIARLIETDIDVIICGDERQSTYRTNNAKKHKGKTLKQFLRDAKLTDKCPIDESELNGSHRCAESVIQFANKLYPDFPQTVSLVSVPSNRHSGVWIVPSSSVEAYASEFHPVALRNTVGTETVNVLHVLNFGRSKGRTYADVLIYPVGPVRKWLVVNKVKLSSQTRARFYVAITRARYSVGIVIPDEEVKHFIGEYSIWNSSQSVVQGVLPIAF